MKIISPSRGEIIINTPVDDPTQFDPDWRNSVAKVLVENPKLDLGPEFAYLRHDPYIKGQVDFLRALEAGKEFKPVHRDFRLAFRWSQGTTATHTRFRLEPLLLTPVPYSTIAQGLAGDELTGDPFLTYEKLYFNIRNKAGQLSKSCHLRSFFALPKNSKVDKDSPAEELWRVTAAQHGYMGLIRLWVWPDAPGMRETREEYMSQEAWRAAQSVSLDRIMRGQMNSFDLTAWIGKYTENEKMRRETQTLDSPATKMASLLTSILQQVSPKVLAVAKTVDAMEEETKAIRDRFRAQTSFGGGVAEAIAESVDKKGVAVVEDMLHNTFHS